jgi:hypothetical protein
MEAQVILLRSEFEAEKAEALKVIGIEEARSERVAQDRTRMARSRYGDADGKPKSTKESQGNARRSTR